MNLIVAVDKNWGIGKDNNLLVRIPADQKYFREMTMGKVVVMGRKTLESFPGARPLKDRINIVLTHNKDYKSDAIAVHSTEELYGELKKYRDDDVFVIGGEAVYRLLLPKCDVAYVTKIDFSYDADTYFPDLDRDQSWKMTDAGAEQTYFDIEYSFCKYERL